MSNRGARSIALIAALAIWETACSEKPAQLSALDRAYRSGVFTKEEYESKKTAIEHKAEALRALDKALQSGILTKDEYRTKTASLLASETAAPLVEHATRTNAFPAAVPSENPIPTKPAQDLENATAASSAPADLKNHYLRLKKVLVMDQNGFERPLASASMLLPTDWQSEGATQWNIKDSCNTIQTTFHASGPDGRGFDVFPEKSWSWADDPTFLQRDFAQKAQMGTHACDVMPPMGAADYVRRNLAGVRPNARIVSIEPLPKITQVLQQQARQTEQAAAQYQLRQRVRPDIVRARLRYNLSGKPVEEWLIVKTIVTGTLGPSFSVSTGQMTQAFTYSCTATTIAERAPQGELDSSERFFELLVSTIRVSPEWQSRVNQHASAMQQIELKGIRDRSAIVSKSADHIRNIQRQGWENKQKSEDHVFQQSSEATRDVETYRNPATGETVELSNQYGRAWVNDRGEYLLSDQASFDPSVTFKENWTPLQHVKP
jgi:hypothetical protein